MVDLAYRVLGLIVLARFQIAFLVGLANAVCLLLEVRLLLESPSNASSVGLIDSPLLLTAAVLVLAQLPPGILFQAAARAVQRAPDEAPSTTDGPWGCRVSGHFSAGLDREWRLLVPSTLQLTPWGGVELRAESSTPPARPSAAPWGVRAVDWYRPVGIRPPLWGPDPALRQRRLPVRPLPEPPVASTVRLAIAGPTLDAVVGGWQYAGPRRYPALRLQHRGTGERPQFTYLAFTTAAARDAVLARLG